MIDYIIIKISQDIFIYVNIRVFFIIVNKINILKYACYIISLVFFFVLKHWI